MGRKNITTEQEHEFQEPIFEAVENYFDTVYEPETPIRSVFSGIDVDTHNVMIISAMMVPAKHKQAIKDFMMKMREGVQGALLIDDDAEPRH